MNDSTFNQRRAISNMCAALRIKPPEGFRDFSKQKASEEIDRLKKLIAEKGFPEREEE
jgi:hypothetical protein